ncbi:MAG: hypothetical protein M1822_004172 [Bathelium mastoideum]|nr:MAG: hypothetical protein M1822_004172 [Bathelium mastoideum]
MADFHRRYFKIRRIGTFIQDDITIEAKRTFDSRSGNVRTYHPADSFAEQEVFAFSVLEDDFIPRPTELTVPDTSIFFDHVQYEDDDRGGPLYDDLDDFFILPSLSTLTGAGNANGTDVAKEVRQQCDDLIPEHVLGCNHRLSRLDLNLARRFEQYWATARSQDSPTMDFTSDLPAAAPTNKTGQEGPPYSKPFGEALSNSSEFLAIIQSCTPERRDTYH